VSEHDQFICSIRIPGRQSKDKHLEHDWVNTNFSSEYLNYFKSNKPTTFVPVPCSDVREIPQRLVNPTNPIKAYHQYDDSTCVFASF
jgi:hypothetical protein